MWQSLTDVTLTGGPWAVLGLLVLRGWLIPRWWHRERVADLKAAITALEATVAEREKQIGILLGRQREPTS